MGGKGLGGRLMANWLEGISSAEIIRGIFHVSGIFAFVKALFLERRVTTLEEKINRMEERVVWGMKE